MKAQIVQSINEKGWVLLKGQSIENCTQISSMFGEVILTTEVKVRENSKALVTSNRALGPHTDHHLARHIMWYCLSQSDTGGETVLLDTWPVLAQLAQQDRQELSEILLKEHSVFKNDTAHYPLLSYDQNLMPVIYYSFWLAEGMQCAALSKFQKLLAQTEATLLRLEPGDILVVNNHRILHGRKAICGQSNRHLRRFWISNNVINLN